MGCSSICSLRRRLGIRIELLHIFKLAFSLMYMPFAILLLDMTGGQIVDFGDGPGLSKSLC
jgi:hypothetical protein